MTTRPVRVLCIGGSDSGAGAGIQADIKTAAALGAYAMTAITAVTAQNTLDVISVHPVPPDIVRAQIMACLDDIGADAVKIGMLHSSAIVDVVADVLRERAARIPLVLDPVLVATSGTPLLDEAGIALLREKLIPRATLVTPNLPEAERLTGIACGNDAAIVDAGRALIALGANAALIKGGHGSDETLRDILVTREGYGVFPHARQKTPHTHGTGCTLATAIAVGLAERRELRPAVLRARAFVQHAISFAPGLGHGKGPLEHNFAQERGRTDLDCWGMTWITRR